MNNKKEVFFMYLSAFTIGLPYTIIGLLVWLYIASPLCHKDHSVIFVEGRVCIILGGDLFGGVSLGIVYLVDESENIWTSCHELGHTIQFKWMGILFIPVVAIPSVIRYHYRKHLRSRGIKLKTQYDDIWFERQASTIGANRFYNYLNTQD